MSANQLFSDRSGVTSPEGVTPENTSPASASQLTLACKPIEQHLVATEKIIAEEVLEKPAGFIADRLKHTPLAGGKRMRPILLFLSAGCVGEISEKHRYLAAAMEIVHTATLVHDDVLDDADTRRHVSTINSIWDNTTSVLIGDYLFTQSFEIAARSNEVQAIGMIARSSRLVCEGEMLQNASIGNVELSESEYFNIIELKTAELCKCSCGMGALASGADKSVIVGFEEFGVALGTSFQIVDDVLDLVGSPKEVGKTLGTDLANKKMTLPLIHSLRESSAEGRQRLLEQLHSDSPDANVVMQLLDDSGSINYSRNQAHAQAQKAVDFIRSLPSSDCATGLRILAEFVLERTH